MEMICILQIAKLCFCVLYFQALLHVPSFVFFVNKASERHRAAGGGTCTKANECVVCALEEAHIKIGASNILAHKSLAQKLKGMA